MVGHFKESKYDISLLVVQPEGIVMSDEVEKGDNKITDRVAWTFSWHRQLRGPVTGVLASCSHTSLYICSSGASLGCNN